MYSWVVFIHVLSVLTFLTAHGASAAAIFMMPGTRSVERLRTLLHISRRANGVADAALLLLLAAGIVAGFMGSWWGQYWIWTALGVLILITVGMGIFASGPLERLRLVVSPEEARGRPRNATVSPSAPPTDQEVAALVAGVNPWPVTLVGSIGLALILWLMLFKPF